MHRWIDGHEAERQIANDLANIGPKLPSISLASMPANSLPSEYLGYHQLVRQTDSCSGRIAGAFGVAAGVTALFFLGEIPRVRNDILRQFPFFDTYLDRRVAPEDNVGYLSCCFVCGLTNSLQPF